MAAISNNICAQQPYGNDVVTLTAPPPSCTYTSTDWITKYGRINNYIPTSSTPVKTIRVNFNIFQKNNGSGNFQNNVADINRLNAIANKLNDLFQTIQAPSDPWLGVAFIGDSKIRVELANIFFYPNTAICESSNSAGALAAISAASPQRMEQLNIIFTEPITNPGAGGWAYAPTVGMFNQNQLIHTFSKWLGGSNVADMNTARHLAHELAHCFNVMHLYDVGTCCSETCNTTDPDYLIDCFGPQGLAVCPQNAPGGSTCDPFASATDHLCTNNIMSGKDNVDFYISPLQMGRIHWALAVTNARRYLKTCPFNGIAYQINSNETWDFDIRMYNSITINAGATLTLKCNLQMADNAKITVKRGARLIVDGGKITSSCSMWKGVEVWGTASKDQLPIANNPDQGYMQLTNGGIIENAVTAISVAKMVSGQPDLSFTGGIVFIENQADIRNCNRGVVFYDYENVNNTNGLILANASTIRNSFFTITGLLNNGLPHDAFIILNGTRGVKIRGNEFKNTGTNYYCTPDRRGAGIRFHDAIGNVEPTYNCNIIPCQILKRNLFTGLYHGVEVLNTNTTRVVNIIDNDFNSVTRAIHIENADMSAIYNNNILNVPQHEFNPCCTCSALGVTQAYAIYIGNTANFICENNTITGTALLGDKPDYGIVVSDCGAVAKSVYNNTITGFEFGSHNQFDNGGTPITDGLLINCNDFTNNDIDINVEGTVQKPSRVAYRQGYCSQSDGTTKARNRFNTNNCTGNENQFRLFEQMAGVYYGHNDKTQCNVCDPKCYDITSLPVIIINCPNQNFSKPTSCPNLANDDGTALPNRIATLTGDINTINTLFDGNNAPALIALINAMANVTNVKNTLLGYSPFVSDEALIALINKATQFGTQNLIDVLIANSKLQPDVQSKINTLTTALKNQINTAIASSQATAAASDDFHQQLRGKMQQRDILKGFLRSKYLSFDAYNNYGLDSTLSDMANETRFSYKPQKLNLNLQKGNYTTANTILADINTQPGYGNYNTLMGNVIGLMQSGTGLYGLSQNTSNTAFTDSLAKDSTKIGYTIARNLMTKVYGNLYNEVLIKSGPSGGGSRNYLEGVRNNLQAILFPNPAKDLLTIQLVSSEKLTKDIIVSITNATGQKILHKITTIEREQIQIDISKFMAGFYIIDLSTTEGFMYHSKFIVQR